MPANTMLQENYTEIMGRITAAAERVNRSPEEIRLVAVSKRVALERVLAAIDMGQYIFGENYVQESMQKIPAIRKARPLDALLFQPIERHFDIRRLVEQWDTDQGGAVRQRNI